MIFLKNYIINICSIGICVFAIFISVFNLKISKMEGAIPSNSYATNIDEFVKENEEILLSIYDMDISSETLSNMQKSYITNLYIIKNRDKYIESIKDENDDGFKISSDVWNNVYWYLFSDNLSSDNTKDIQINLVNKEKFHIDSRNIMRYSCINDIHILEIEYISKFLNEEYKCNVKYNIGYKDNKYYIIGFVIN